MAADSTSVTSSTSSSRLVLYDIAFALPREENNCAPNPWKARYALNFKNVPYSTQWVQLPEIAKVRRSLKVPAGRKFADGTDFYTLPILTDSTTGAAIGDSLDIAAYLQDTFPESGAGDLFPQQVLDYVLPKEMAILIPLSERKHGAHAEYARFNDNVDMAFTLHVHLMAFGMKYDPERAEEIKAEFVRRASLKSWDDMAVYGDARDKLRASLKNTLQGLAALLKRDLSGPFLLGSQPSYADIIIGAWLKMMSRTLPETEWEDFQTWLDGVFGRLHDALQRFGGVK